MVRDDDFDRRRTRQDHAVDAGVDRPRTPGKQTLVDAQSNRSNETPSAPGKRARASIFDTWTQGLAEGPDPVAEAELHVRKAREIVAKLREDVPATERPVLNADLRGHLDNARTAGARAFTRPDGREVAEAMRALVAEAEPILSEATVGDSKSGHAPDPVAVARRGVDGPGQRLPHIDEVQRHFGAHDLSGVRAHIGGAAGQASRELGAHAYTHGNDIAFATQPDLGLVAHEATHIIQQRAGVSLKGVDGGGGDAHEQQADLVAEHVVQGKSAAGVLSSIAGGGGASAGAVQRKSGDSSASAASATPGKRPGIDERDYQGPLTATAYFAYNERKFLEAVRARLSTVQLPPPHERLVWTAGSVTLSAAFAAAIHKVAGTGMDLALRLPELLYPTDPWELIDLHRDISSGRVGSDVDAKSAMGTRDWNNVAGMSLAVEVEAALRRSLPRMGLRYVAQADDYSGPVPPELLVASHPFDRVVAELLCDPAVARFTGGTKARDKRDTHQPAAFKDGLRLVNVEWQGTSDPKLWNWVRATPASATAEEVAAVIFERGDGKNHTEYAYALVASPPFFRVAPRWARELPGAKEHAPASTTTNEGAEANSALDLANSANVDEAARQQAGAPVAKVDIHALQGTLDKSKAQLELAAARLASWKLGYLVGPALRWVDKHRDAVLASPTDTLRAWAPIVSAQSSMLADALGELIEVLDVAASAHVQPNTPEAKPFKDVIEAFAIAMGESQLAQSAAPQLANARRLKAALPLTLLDRTMLETRQAAHDLADSGAPKEIVATAVDTSNSLEAGAVDARAKMMTGADLSATDLESMTVAASEAALRTRVSSLRTKLEQIQGVADAQTETSSGKLVNTSKLHPLKMKLAEIEPAVWNIVETMNKEAVPAGPFPADNAQSQRMFADTRKAAVARAQAAFARLHDDYKLDTFFHEALDTITEAERRNAYFTLALEIAVLLGIGIVGGVVGNAVGGVVRSALLADAATDTLAFARTATAARIAGTAANVATDAAVQAVGQTAIFGGSTKLTFVENIMTNLMTLGALRPFHGLAGDLGKLDREAQGLWKVVSGGKVVLVEAGTLTMETLVAAGASYVAARLVEGKPPPDNDTAIAWAMQGASMAVGKFVHGKLQGLTERWSHIPEEKVHFLKRARAQEQLAKSLESTGSTEMALQLLEEHVRILDEERALLHDPKALAKLGLDEGQVQTLRAGNDAARADSSSQAFEVMKLRFLGLEPIAANGLAWSGNRAQLEIVLSDAGGGVKNVQPAGEHQWAADMGGQRVTFVEIDKAPAADHVPTPAEAEMHRAMAREAIRVYEERSMQLTTRITGLQDPKVKHITIGDSTAGVLSHSTQKNGAGALPGPIGEALPEAIAISDNPDWWRILGDRDIGQPVGEWKSKGYRWQPGAFNSDHEGFGRASDVAYANAMTALDTGMASVRARITDVEEFKVGESWPVEAKWRVKLNGQKWVYCDTVVFAGGLGVPRTLPALNDVQPVLEKSGRFTYAQQKLIPDVGEGETIIVIGDSGTAGWAAQEAIRKSRKAIIVARNASMPAMPKRLRDFAAQHSIPIVAGEIKSAAFEKGELVLQVGSKDQPVPQHTIRGAGVSLAIGQEAVLPEGMQDMRFKMVKRDGRVVALEAYDPATPDKRPTGFMVQGGAMTTAPFKDERHPIVDDVKEYKDALKKQASADDVPQHSKDVEPSIHQSGRNIPLANDREHDE